MAMLTETRKQEISARANKFKGCYVPIFKSDCEGRPYHAGTMVSVAFPGFHALVTAKHVLERDDNNPCDEVNQIYVFSEGAITQIRRINTGILPLPSGNQPLDLSVILTDDVDALNVFTEPLCYLNLWRGPLTSTMYVAACGYPRTKNNRKGRQLAFRPYGYFGTVASDAITQRAGYDPRFHFSLKFNRKRSVKDGGKGGYAPDPDGISGGPVFLVDDFGKGTILNPALAGIVIGRDPKLQLLICIRAEFIEHIARCLHHDVSTALATKTTERLAPSKHA